ncbi:MAG: DinB family protein [Saprospiraceae bacterium]|jgi:uncharacterized damage-inducible protein DinB|nr:DinB family protein [Saprospiraceae bacterium]
MDSKTQLLKQFDLLDRWFKTALDNLSDKETNQRIDPKMNHIKYIAGHLFHTNYIFAQFAGVKAEPKWSDLFAGQGKTKALDNYPYPDINEIIDEWEKLFPQVRAGLSNLSEEILNKEVPSPIAQSGIFDSTIRDLWTFFNYHQAYHIGQIGLLRKGLGKETMKYQ